MGEQFSVRPRPFRVWVAFLGLQITKHHTLGGLKSQMDVLTSPRLEARAQVQGVHRAGSLRARVGDLVQGSFVLWPLLATLAFPWLVAVSSSPHGLPPCMCLHLNFRFLSGLPSY